MPAPFTFTLPPELSAKEPPERRGIRRDQVQLLVIDRATGDIDHTRFDKIDRYLRAGDLLDFRHRTCRSDLPPGETDPLRVRLGAVGSRLLPNCLRDRARVGRNALGW